MDCQQFELLLHPYIDGELDVATMVAAEAHLSECPRCAQRVAHFRALGIEIREAVKITTPSSLRERAKGLVESAIAARRARRRTLLRTCIAAAAVLVLTTSLILARQLSHPGLDDDDIQEVTALHIRSGIPGHLLDLESGSLDRIAPWFARQQLPFTPWIGAVSTGGFALAGARLDYCDGQRVAVLVYRKGDHVANLVIYPAEHPGDRPPATASNNGVQLCGWTRHGMQYFIASDLAESELAAFPRLTQM